MRRRATLMLLTLTMVSGCQWRRSADMLVMSTRQAAPRASMAQPQAAVPTERRVIRNAELTVEIDRPAEGKSRVEALAESMGGFLVASEVEQYEGEAAERAVVRITLRVPAARFGDALAEIRKVGRVRREKITGQDVTEEYVDLEAQLHAKRAFEAQLLDILKQARKVADALEVQKALAEARTQIERLEGRRRFLENQTDLSTISLRLEPPTPLVSASGFGLWRDFKTAIGEGFELAVAVMFGLIRGAIILVPVVLFVGVPGYYLLRLVRRRWQGRKPALAQ